MVAWMLYSCVVTACVAAIALALEPMLRTRRVATRWLWVAAVVSSLGVTLVAAVMPRAVAGSTSAGLAIEAAGDAAPTLGAASQLPSGDDIALVAWLLSSLLMLVVVGGGILQLRRIRARAPRARMGGELVSLARDVGPGTTWFGEPRIIVPAWAQSLGDEAVALLVLHEREHERAGDPRLLAGALLAIVVVPWNLPLWLIVRRLRAAIEIDCDARVLSAGSDVRRYGELLLTVAARRGRRTPSVLLPFAAFASSASSLERRIRAMTERPLALTLRRMATSATIVATALVAACEMRRPEPLAPVTTYTIRDGVASAAPTASATHGDSVRQSLEGELKARVVDTVLAGNPSDPVIMIYSSTGVLLQARRLDSGVKADDAIGVPKEAIATVDVIKKGDWLPSNARGGVIRVVLKPGAEEMRASPSGSAMRGGEEPGVTRVGEGAKITLRDDVLMVVYDAEGKEVARSIGAAVTKRVDPAQIATVDVYKTPAQLPADAPNGMVKIVLKPGAVLKP